MTMTSNKSAREVLTSLMNEVVFPFESCILKDEKVADYLSDPEVQAKHNIGIAKLAVGLLSDAVRARNLLIEASKAHNDLNIDTDLMKKYLSIFFKLHKKWTKENFKKDKYYNDLMDRFDKLFMKLYKEEHEKQDENDGFLMFENEEVDEAIEHMHYEDNKKITAEEYFSFGEIMDDDLIHLIEDAEECETILVKHFELEDGFLVDFIHILTSLSGILFRSIEFKDIGYAMENFIKELELLDISSLDDMQKELAWNLLSQINEDIQNWIKSVFIDRTAVDIHYFDASFLANIAQFSIMLAPVEEESEDDFFF